MLAADQEQGDVHMEHVSRANAEPPGEKGHSAGALGFPLTSSDDKRSPPPGSKWVCAVGGTPQVALPRGLDVSEETE